MIGLRSRLVHEGDGSSAATRANPCNLMGFLDAIKAGEPVPGWHLGHFVFPVMAGTSQDKPGKTAFAVSLTHCNEFA